MDKRALLLQLRTCLEGELAALRMSLEAAREAATHEEATPENEYDTRALEASYLAGAQETRAQELEAALGSLAKVPMRPFKPGEKAGAGAVVDVDKDGEVTKYFLTPVGPGYRLRAGEEEVVTLTTASPLGRALVGKAEGEVAVLPAGGDEKELEILAVR